MYKILFCHFERNFTFPLAPIAGLLRGVGYLMIIAVGIRMQRQQRQANLSAQEKCKDTEISKNSRK